RILVDKIGKLSSEEDRLNALQKVGVRNGKDLNAVITEMHGDLDQARQAAEDMGLIITTEQAKQADKFTDSLHILNLQLKAIGYTVGREVLPIFQELLTETSAELKENKDQWKF